MTRLIAAIVGAATLLACAAPAPAPAPAPVPSRSPAPATPSPATPAPTPPRPTTAPRRDSAATPARTASRAPRTYSRVPLPRSRTDTLAARELATPVRVCAGGDVTLGSNLDRAWARTAALRMRNQFNLSDRPSELVEPLRPLVESADVVLLNVESAIGEGAAPSKCGKNSTNCFAFRAPSSAADALRSVARDRIVIGNVANNHARDAGSAGVKTTVSLLRRAGVFVTGDDTLATPVPTAAGDTIGVLGFYTSPETPDARDTAGVFRHVARAAARFPIVIVTMHLGAEGKGAQRTRDATEIFLGKIDRGNPVAFADAAVRGGASLVIGHGPHVLRAVEWRERGALIAYSLGNLLTYGPFTVTDPQNRGAVLCATIDATGRVAAASIGSTIQVAPGVLRADTTRRAAALIDSLGRLDFRFTGARVGPDGEMRPSPR